MDDLAEGLNVLCIYLIRTSKKVAELAIEQI
jgi:hypothetical protein